MADKFHLWRIGSDPEFGFIRSMDWTPVLVPAAEIITVPKQVALESFIGMDSHTLGGNGQLQTTAELRPPPSRNIRLHLYYIAYGISEVAKYLRTKDRFSSVILYALPALDKEFMGGHIHVSGFLDEPGHKFMQEEFNLTWMGPSNGWQIWNENKSSNISFGTSSTTALQAALYHQGVLDGRVTTPISFMRAMNYLGLPFELWMQPWVERKKRFDAYEKTENGHYFIRWLHSKRPSMPRFQNMAYVHMEYRVPSTWLIHPWLAYAYFALAKLTILNWGRIWPRMLAAREFEIHTERGNQDAKEVFLERLKELERDGLFLSNDIKDIWKAVSICDTSREAWFANKTAGVDVEAWRALL